MSWRLANFDGLFHLTDLHLAVQRFLIPPELDIHGLSDRCGGNHSGQILGVGNCLAVNSYISCSIPLSLPGSRDYLKPELPLSFPNDFASSGVAPDAHAEPTASYMSLLLQLRSNFFGHVDRDGESDALSRGDDRRVDTDDLSFGVDERATAVPRVDRGIGLNEIVIGSGTNHSSLGADNTRGDRIFEPGGPTATTQLPTF